MEKDDFVRGNFISWVKKKQGLNLTYSTDWHENYCYFAWR